MSWHIFLCIDWIILPPWRTLAHASPIDFSRVPYHLFSLLFPESSPRTLHNTQGRGDDLRGRGTRGGRGSDLKRALWSVTGPWYWWVVVKNLVTEGGVTIMRCELCLGCERAIVDMGSHFSPCPFCGGSASNIWPWWTFRITNPDLPHSPGHGVLFRNLKSPGRCKIR